MSNIWPEKAPNSQPVSCSRAQNVVDSATRQAVGDDAVAEGQFLNISQVHIPPTMGDPGLWGKASAFEKITSFDRDNYRLSWMFWGSIPRWMLHAERYQILTDEGDGRTRYYTVEAFKGALAHVVKAIHQKGLSEGFQAMADALKDRVEKTPTLAL